MFYYTHHIGDYLSDTANLSLLEHGVYTRLIQEYYKNERPLSGDICRTIGARTEDEKSAVEYVLAKYFVIETGEYRQKRCDDYIDWYHKNSDKNRENGKLGGRPKKPKNNPLGFENNPTGSESEPKHNPTHKATNNHKPITINHKPITINHKPSEREIALSAPPAKKSTRLPDDWRLPVDDGKWAMGQGLTRQQVLFESDKFRDHWLSAAGQRGVKRDWRATWRNWVRRSATPQGTFYSATQAQKAADGAERMSALTELSIEEQERWLSAMK